MNKPFIVCRWVKTQPDPPPPILPYPLFLAKIFRPPISINPSILKKLNPTLYEGGGRGGLNYAIITKHLNFRVSRSKINQPLVSSI